MCRLIKIPNIINDAVFNRSSQRKCSVDAAEYEVAIRKCSGEIYRKITKPGTPFIIEMLSVEGSFM